MPLNRTTEGSFTAIRLCVEFDFGLISTPLELHRKLDGNVPPPPVWLGVGDGVGDGEVVVGVGDAVREGDVVGDGVATDPVHATPLSEKPVGTGGAAEMSGGRGMVRGMRGGPRHGGGPLLGNACQAACQDRCATVNLSSLRSSRSPPIPIVAASASGSAWRQRWYSQSSSARGLGVPAGGGHPYARIASGADDERVP